MGDPSSGGSFGADENAVGVGRSADVIEGCGDVASMDGQDITADWIRDLAAVVETLPLGDATERGGLGKGLRAGLLEMGPSPEDDGGERVDDRRGVHAGDPRLSGCRRSPRRRGWPRPSASSTIFR